MYLKSFLKNEFIKLIPFQDKIIVVELLINFLNNAQQVRFVELCYLNDVKLEEFKQINGVGFNFGLKNDLELFFNSNYKSIVNTQLFSHQKECLSVYVPFFVKNNLYMVLSLKITENVLNKELLDDLDGISFYCSILLDRIEYASNLQVANQKLNSLNTSLEKMNKKLNLDLKLAISDFEEQSSLAQEISQKSSTTRISKELFHEVSNPLSLIQFDLDEINSLCSQLPLDKGMLDEIIELHKLDTKKVYNVVSKIETYSEKMFCDLLDEYRAYPLVISFLKSIKIQHDLKSMAKCSSKNIQNISVLLESLSNFGALNVFEKEVLDARIIVNDVFRLFRNKIKALGIKLYLPNVQQAFLVSAEKSRLHQVLINIVKNSINALENVNEKSILVQLKKARNFISIIIIDSGPGFNQEELKYNIKKSSSKSRVGLGLLISKNILSQIGGNIIFEKQNSGMRIILKIPLINM